jgi:SAM-dependent methyltransferase
MSGALQFTVLRSQEEIDAATAQLSERELTDQPTLSERGVSAVKHALRIADVKAQRRPDLRKSWDVLRTIEAIEAGVGPDDPVLDVGSFASAILPALSRLGYRRLSGIDLDERIAETDNGGAIEYVVGDLTRTPWPDGHFAAISAISVIEHGVEEEALFTEVSRLLRPGGAFLFSTDYWPEKIDTSDTRLFGLPWRIFSVEEMERFISRAAEHGLRPVTDPAPALRQVRERPIHFEGRDYTFVHGGLTKASPEGP